MKELRLAYKKSTKATKKYTFCEPSVEDKVWTRERKEAWKRESDKSQKAILDKYNKKQA